jgi:hypothetical protein
MFLYHILLYPVITWNTVEMDVLTCFLSQLNSPNLVGPCISILIGYAEAHILIYFLIDHIQLNCGLPRLKEIAGICFPWLCSMYV